MTTTTRFKLFALSLLLIPAAAANAADNTFEETLTASDTIFLEVGTGSGSIEISSGPGREISVTGKVKVNRKSLFSGGDKDEILQAVIDNPPIKLEGGVLEIGKIEDRAIRRRVSISYVIVVPADTEVKAKTGSGSIDVTNIDAPVEVSAGSGRLHLENIGDAVKASTGSGSIRAENVAGGFKASAGSGSIYLSQTAPGDVKVSTGSGSAELVGVVGAVKASAGSGTITVDGVQTGDWKLGTGSGSVRVSLPDDAAFTLDAESSSGGITIEHPLMVEGKISKRHIRGEVRGGGPELRIDTGSGSIKIL